MAEHRAIYEKAPTTSRSARALAQLHGFTSVQGLAESLPPEADVMDVGAGASPFGHEVTALRPDIRWTNFDYSYHQPHILEHMQRNAPPNLQHIAGDATKLAEIYPPESFDKIYSIGLFMHLSLDSLEPARAAARGIATVLRNEGCASIGVMFRYPNGRLVGSLRAYHLAKEASDTDEDLEHAAAEVARCTKAPWFFAFPLRVENEAVIPAAGTTMITKKEDGRSTIYDAKSGTYVREHSPRGMIINNRLRVAMVSYIGRKILSSYKGCMIH